MPVTSLTGLTVNERQGPTFPRVRGRIREFSSLNNSKKLFMPLSMLKAVFIMMSEIFLKGGDFMGRVESGLGSNGHKPVQEVIAAGRVPGTNEDPFPKVVGRTPEVFRISTANGIDLVESPVGQSILDDIATRSATAMSGGE